MQLLSGSLYSAILCAAAELGIAEALDEPRAIDDLAARVGAQAAPLERLLRALAVLGLVQRLPDGRWQGAEVLAFLRGDHESSLRALALLQGETAMMRAWQRCAEAVRTGKSGFELAHGRKLFDFLDGDERLRGLFHCSLRGTAGWNEAVVEALDLSARRLVVDVGAGDGRLLEAIVRRWPHLRGVAFDRPGVAQKDCNRSQSFLEGDFFEGVPEGDVHILRWVLHDWPDDDAVSILVRCREASRGVVYVVENLIGPDDPGAALLDMSMMILTGGRERTRDEFAALFERAGLRLLQVLPTRAGVKILEAAPAPA
jgi:O-methyltransferase domain/Dimerisation domain